MFCQPGTRSLKLLAPAKLNLFLRVLRRREDGFHELETVMTAINVYDTLFFEASDTSEVSLQVVLSPSRTLHSAPVEPIPAGPENLVLRAAQLLRDYAGSKQGARITLFKRIPSAAGMGGGSSDAAATLAGLNRLWNLSLNQAQLIELAARLGSDIGFFLGGRSAAVCRGRGELIEPLEVPTGLYFVVARPASGLSTPAVFKNCRPSTTGPSADEFIQSLRQPSLSRMVRLLHNDLQAPAESINEDVRELRKHFEKLPLIGHQMSGSGTSYFGICHSSRQAVIVAARLRQVGVPWVKVARSCS